MKLTLIGLLLLPSWLLAQGLKLDEPGYESLPEKRSVMPVKKLPGQVDLSGYVPSVIDQGKTGTCVAISVGYYMRTILEAQRRGINTAQGMDKVNALRSSPWYLYNSIKDADDNACTEGIGIGAALEFMKQNGLPSFAEVPSSTCQRPNSVKINSTSRLLDYVKLFGTLDASNHKELATKKALSELSPVVVGLQTTASLSNMSLNKTVSSRIMAVVPWRSASDQAASRTRFSRWSPELSPSLGSGHAVCVVGYDDRMFGKGAFKLVNSWGSNWGDQGYFWIAYDDFNKYAKYGYQAYVQPAGKPDENILSADLSISVATLFFGPEMAVARTQAGANLTAYRVLKPQRTGTPFKFNAMLSKQTYLYLVTASATDSVAVKLFPDPGFSPLIGKDTRMDLPAETILKLEGNTGLEYWLFLFSETPIDIDGYVKKLNQEKGQFTDRVQVAFGNALVPYQQVEYKEKKMGFFLKSKNRGRIVPLLVSMNHVK
ncbi:C1 family peptidase [Fibrella aquatica]|uniref:C1 family peptidase n=1 Tax=Fibrella aquatica TaxID=3242487 RepID=UPI0035215082